MAKIRIFSDTKTGKVTFDGSTVSDKDIGSVEAVLHPTETNRIIIKSTRIFKRGSSTEFRVFLKRLRDSRVQNEAGETLTNAPYNYTRDQVVDYLNQQFRTPVITEYFEYNPITDRLEAQRDVQVNKNGFFLGDKHKMASGASNIYFEDLDNKANSYPVFGEVLDQSLSANQLPGQGVTKPKSRIFQDYNPVKLGGDPVNGTAIDYDGDNFFPFNISGQGITTVTGESISSSQQLKYEIVVNGISVYVQYLAPGATPADTPITWYFDQPLDIEAGTTLRATIYKISIQNNQEVIDGILKVNEGDATPTRYHTQVLARLFDDKQIALKEDVDQLLNGSIYKGAYDASGTGTPALPTGSDVLGDFYRVTTPNALSGYNTGDILVFNGTDYDHVAEQQATQSDIKNSALRIYDIYVKAGYLGSVQDGSVLYPYNSIETAIGSANDGDQIYLEGSFEISGEITIPSTKSLFFYGADDAAISFTSYADTNAGLIKFTGTDNSKELKFVNITFKNAGDYALNITKAAKVEIDDCEFTTNGWNGTALNTILPSTTTALLGYDSTDTDLQAFYAGANASDGGAVSLTEITQVVITGNTVTKNLKGFTLVDCGVGGAGVITRNQITQNIDAGINLTAGSTHSGSQNITTSMNVVAYNAGNGLQVVGGLNNKFSQNEVNGNWNAGFYSAGSGNATLRDCGLYDNNRSAYNGIGLTGAKASVVLDESANLLGNTISLNADARFIAEILDTQVHYTGLGANTEKIGFYITSAVGALADDDKNIIKVDDVGFIGQDYAIDMSDVDTTNLRLSLGDNSYQTIGEKAVREPVEGYYYELPFSNHSMRLNNVDLSVTNTGNIIVKEGVGGVTLNPYSVNELQAVAYGTEIMVLLKGSRKIQFIVPVSGCSIDGSSVNSVLNNALVQLNDLFTNTTGFAAGGNPVTNFALNSNDLTITLQDSTSFTVDVTTLGVDENKFVTSGALSGSNLNLTMNDASIVTIDASNMINGSTLPPIADDWYIAYGNDAGDEIVTAGIVNTYASKQPFYYGEFLSAGEEYIWTHDDTGGYFLGIWSGAETATTDSLVGASSNWSSMFAFDRASGIVSHTSSVGVDVASRYASGYNITNNTVLALAYDTDNYLKLFDISNGDRVLIGQSNTQLVGSSQTLFFGGTNQPNAKFPVLIKRFTDWTVVHDFDSSETSVFDGVEADTVLRSNLAISPGQKFMTNFNYFGRTESIGFGYTGASSGVNNAYTNIEYRLFYNSSELLKAADSDAATGGNWTWNTSATGYYNPNGDDSNVGYWPNGGTGNLGMISVRYLSDNTVELWHESNNEKIATLATTLDGSDIHFFAGFNEAHPYNRIPSVSKQTIGQGSQPITTFAPDVSNQTFVITESAAFNAQIALDTGSDIVNIYGEENAPSWVVLNQVTGLFAGTAPSYTGVLSSDSYVVDCKAANALGGITSFQVTLSVAEVTYTNTKSLKFTNNVNSYLGGNAALITSMEKSSGTSGAANAWSLSMWLKGSSESAGQTIFYFGHADTTNSGHIEVRQTNFQGAKRLRLRYGSSNNYVQLTSPNGSITPGTWQHVLITYTGGTTGAGQSGISDYYSRFKIFIDGTQQTTSNAHPNYGYSGSIIGQNYRFGRYASGQYPKDMFLNQMAIWDSDQKANIADIYNGGATQDMSLLSTPPAHFYEIENSTTTIQDLIGNANLVGYNFGSSDLVTDAP